MRLNINEQTAETIAALASRAAKEINISDFLYIMRAIKGHPQIQTKLTPEICVEAINQQLADGTPWNAVEILNVLGEQPQLVADVLELLTKNIQFPPAHIEHPHNYLLQVFSDYPQLHPAIHAFGATTNQFAKLLTDKPKSKYGQYPVLSLSLTDEGFMADGIIASTIGHYDAPIPSVFENWVRVHFSDRSIPATRDELLTYYIPAIVGLMKDAASSTTLPESLKAVAERQIVRMCDFLKPRGIEI